MAAEHIRMDRLRQREGVVGRIHARRRTGRVDEADGDRCALAFRPGGEVNVVKVARGLQRGSIRLTLRIVGHQLRPAADAIRLTARVIAARWHAGTDETHTFIQSCRRESLEAALAGTIHDQRLPIPLRLCREEVDGTNQAQEHAFEVALLAVLVAKLGVVLEFTILQRRVKLRRFAIGNAVRVDI